MPASFDAPENVQRNEPLAEHLLLGWSSPTLQVESCFLNSMEHPVFRGLHIPVPTHAGALILRAGFVLLYHDYSKEPKIFW